ncbi:MAG: transposase zinc-binding domain-containing protein [Victivallaceae bacterium]|nr:transposase zinc-binding domain-containing protein [Victivallaceae bacterium]
MLDKIFRTYGREYLGLFQNRMSDEQFNTIHAIQICKTNSAGVTTCKCDKCGKFKNFS